MGNLIINSGTDNESIINISYIVKVYKRSIVFNGVDIPCIGIVIHGQNEETWEFGSIIERDTEYNNIINIL